MIPIAVVNHKATKTTSYVITALNSKSVFAKTLFNTATIQKLNHKAINHPITTIITDSTKNCAIISRSNAQIAFLIQISLVLSVTETIIIFITQIHPTNNEIAQIARRR